MKILTVAAALAGALGLASSAAGADGPWTVVDAALGREGKDLPGNVRKYGFPRTDLAVTASGVSIEPALALGSWAAFRKVERHLVDSGSAPRVSPTPVPEGSSLSHMMTMGDLVLLPSEVNPVIRRLAAGNIETTAIHNHLIDESPRLVYVHFAGMGPAGALSWTLRAALELTKTPLATPGASMARLSEDDQRALEVVQGVLGRRGTMAGRVLQVSVARIDPVAEPGMEVPPSMGTAIALNFQIAGAGVATTGDFVLAADEVNPVIGELQANGIDVTALHSHMLRETPRLFFLHFWGVGSPDKIGAGLKAALAKVATKP
jgi:hypothetical protein